jgi:hypothetical protein
MTATLAGVALVARPGTSPAAPVLPGEIDYNRDVRPILSENCFSCHGFDEKARKAELRLDVAEEAYAERDGQVALNPGDPAQSGAWQRIITDDEDDLMPPPKSHLKLTAADKAVLRRWIEQGAKYAGHWAFQPPQRPKVPGGEPARREDKPRAIDAFVQARLAAEGLKPAPEADRATLLRRLSLDLTGLPPGAAEVEAFVQDPDPGAYEAQVDRLLASPHLGERLALDWLDAARYADTNGFSIDGGRHLWLWRDWVIQAFNDNKPYDRFLVEQLAGDLLPGRGEAELTATGFQRNNMVTHEGGTIPEENLANYNADRVKTLGEAVLGLTLACAQCHDHKFDPITQKDYFQIYAFFNTLGDKGLDGNAGVNPGPFIQAKTVLKTDELPTLQQEITALKARLTEPDAAILAAWEAQEQARLKTRGRGLELHPVKVKKVSTPNRGNGFEPAGENGVRLPQVAGLAAYDVAMDLPAVEVPVTGLRVVFHPVAGLPGGGWGSGPAGRKKGADEKPKKGTFVLTGIGASAAARGADQVNLHQLEEITRVTASTWAPGQEPAGALDPRPESGWSPDLSAVGPVRFTVTFARPLSVRDTPHLTAQLVFGAGKSLIPGHFEFYAMTGEDDDSDLPVEVIAALETPAESRSALQQAALWAHCAAHAAELERTRVDLANLEERRAALTQPFPTMVMNVAEKPRETFIFNRGDYMQPTEKVSPGTIAALLPMPEDAPRDRLGLAQWVTMKEHPLTARVAVNRLWKLLFGTGIVATAADFGGQGEWPSHPELLDWLAVEFTGSGWDVKHLLKLMVMSETYRQSSVPTAALRERDPQNRLLARGPRHRLAAELVRDAALKTGGLLVPRIGGPSVNPYMPGDLWREVSHYGSTPATAQTFVQDHGEKLYRRSLYTYWKRTAPPPNMAAFDAPNREVCTIDRGNTTTPLQALVTLNDPQFVEAARAFAQRVLHRPGDDAAKLHWAFMEALSRPPAVEETAVLQRVLARERTRYSANPEAALAALAVGESPRDEALPPAEHAAWMQAASLVLNLSEAVTRN